MIKHLCILSDGNDYSWEYNQFAYFTEEELKEKQKEALAATNGEFSWSRIYPENLKIKR